MKKAVIIGVGAEQGLGAQLAKRFASEGLHVFVASRTQSRIDALTVEIEQAGGIATAVYADATNEEQVIKLFEKAGSGLHLAIYNTGNNFPGQIIDMESDYFEKSWKSKMYTIDKKFVSFHCLAPRSGIFLEFTVKTLIFPLFFV